MDKRIVVIFGARGSGKNTIANTLSGYRQVAFADPIKFAVKEIFGFSDEQLWGPSSKREDESDFAFDGLCPTCGYQCHRHLTGRVWECVVCRTQYKQNITARLALQTLGTEWGRSLNKLLWCQSLFRKLKKDVVNNYVVTDGRFLNEYAFAKEQGALTIGLTRNLVGTENAASFHSSEREVEDVVRLCDIVIPNHDMAVAEASNFLLKEWLNV